MANAINIPILKGDKGDTPVNGVDYFTEVEKDVFKTDIKEALEDDVAGAKEMLDDLVDFYHDIKTIDTHEEVMDARQGFNTLGGVIKQKIFHFDNVATMKSCLTLVAGDVVQTLGYYAVNDGGGATYQIVNDNSLVDDGGSVHDLTNGLKAKLIIKDRINVKQFGAKGDGVTTDDNAFSSAFSFIKNNTSSKILFIPCGKFILNNNYTIDFALNMVGESSQPDYSNICSEIVSTNDDTTSPFIYYHNSNSRIGGFHIEGICFSGSNIIGKPGIYLKELGWRGGLNSLRIRRFKSYGLKMYNVYDMQVQNTQIIDCSCLVDNQPVYSLTLEANTNNVTFGNCHVEGGNYLLSNNYSTSINFDNCHFEFNTDYTDYSHYVFLLGQGSISHFSNCLFATPNINNYEVNDLDDIYHAIGVANNARAVINNCYFTPIGDGNKQGKFIYSANNSFVRCIGCMFNKATVRTNAFNITNTVFDDCYFLFQDNNENTDIKPILLNNSILNNSRIEYDNVQSISNKAIIKMTNGSKVKNLQESSNLELLYVMDSEAVYGTYERSELFKAVSESNYESLMGETVNLSNLKFIVSRTALNSNTFNFAFQSEVTIKKILGGLGGTIITILNNGAQNINLVRDDTVTTGGKIRANTTIAPGNSVRLLKVDLNWFIVN